MPKFYNLIDFIYFGEGEKNPRNKLISILPKEKIKVLDMCTGTAKNAILISSYNPNAEVIGIDISEEMLNMANKKIKNRENIKLLRMDASRLNFNDNSFDFTIISLVLHEMNDKYINKIIGEAKRVTKESGQIIIVEWRKELSLIKRILFYPIKKMEPKGFEEVIEHKINEFIKKWSLKVDKIFECNYTQIISLRK
ncbi:class I SAM-dependent methyltransferase [Clostridium isatidis]|uniref:class I SAM-dependent methyltransferase n=1 Tax=Clostridium isatidis TaxID=182773 RepID=UPI0013E09BD9|nr:methyltransferase domain-containing protein [Clostridium isatidis]